MFPQMSQNNKNIIQCVKWIKEKLVQVMWDKPLFTETSHCLHLTFRGVSVSKGFSGSNNESKSSFSHFMIKSVKVPQRNVKIII